MDYWTTGPGIEYWNRILEWTILEQTTTEWFSMQLYAAYLAVVHGYSGQKTLFFTLYTYATLDMGVVFICIAISDIANDF